MATIPITKYETIEVMDGAEAALRSFQKDVGSTAEIEITAVDDRVNVCISDIEIQDRGEMARYELTCASRGLALDGLLHVYIKPHPRNGSHLLRVGGRREVKITQTHLIL